MEKAFASCWGRSGDNFQSLENKNIPVPTKPQLSLRSYFPLVHWQHPRLPPHLHCDFSVFQGHPTGLPREDGEHCSAASLSMWLLSPMSAVAEKPDLRETA